MNRYKNKEVEYPRVW